MLWLCWLDRYALDVNVERVEDVLLHKKLLEQAREPMNGLVFDVRLSQVINSYNIYLISSDIVGDHYSAHLFLRNSHELFLENI